MRFGLTLAAIGAITAVASGERLINAPIARKVPFRAARFELRTESFRRQEAYLALGLGPQWELEARTLALRGEPTREALDLSYNVSPSFPGVSPGISMGVMDAAGQTRDGRRIWAAMTFRDTAELVGGDQLYELTLGTAIGRGTAFFGGLSLPLDGRNRLQFEWDGFRLAGAYEFRPIRSVALRFILRENQTMLGLSVQARF